MGENSHVKQRDRVASGLCYVCGTSRGQDGTGTLCRVHADNQISYIEQLRSVRKVKNLCIDCGKRPPEEAVLRCKKCAKKISAYAKKKRIKQKKEKRGDEIQIESVRS